MEQDEFRPPCGRVPCADPVYPKILKSRRSVLFGYSMAEQGDLFMWTSTATRNMALVLAASACVSQAAMAQPPLQVELITPISEFTDNVAIQVRNQFIGRGMDVMNMSDASNIAVAKVTIQPKAVFPWHTHPGPVLITVVEGDFVYVLADDCLDRWYQVGAALIDEGFGNVHTAYNPSPTEETVVIATFLNVPFGGPLTILADGPDPIVCPLPTP